jgi:hypothetical protein
MCPPQILEETMKNIGRLVKSAGARKIAVLVRTMSDVIHAAVNFPSKLFVICNECEIYSGVTSFWLWANICASSLNNVRRDEDIFTTF